MKKSLVITGLKVSAKRQEAGWQIQQFVEAELNVSIDLVDFFFLGATEPKPIVITVGSYEQKTSIFQNKKSLKYLENEDGKPIFINDYLPASIGEK